MHATRASLVLLNHVLYYYDKKCTLTETCEALRLVGNMTPRIPGSPRTAGEQQSVVDIRGLRASLPPLGLGERLLLLFDIGGSYYHPMEGRRRSAMTFERALKYFINGWLGLFALFWLWPVAVTLGPLFRFVEAHWLAGLATIAPALLAAVVRSQFRK
jgi:hypothetical protein